MKKRHREVVNPFSIKTKKNRPDQSPVEHIKHASSQDETRRGRNRQPPIRSRDDAVGDGAACFRRTLDDRKQCLGDTHVASIERAAQKLGPRHCRDADGFLLFKQRPQFGVLPENSRGARASESACGQSVAAVLGSVEMRVAVSLTVTLRTIVTL
ncbi:MAG: hypothetical protein WCK55_06180 [Verrucomicrobiota bacterium]